MGKEFKLITLINKIPFPYLENLPSTQVKLSGSELQYMSRDHGNLCHVICVCKLRHLIYSQAVSRDMGKLCHVI